MYFPTLEQDYAVGQHSSAKQGSLLLMQCPPVSDPSGALWMWIASAIGNMAEEVLVEHFSLSDASKITLQLELDGCFSDCHR